MSVRWTLLLASCLSLTACEHLERQVPGRPATPLAADLEAALTPRHPARGLEFERVEVASSWKRYTFGFRTYSDLLEDHCRVTGDYYRTAEAAPGARVPLIVLSPILAGPIDDYLASRYFCQRLCEAGMSAFFLHQETIILDGERDAADLEQLMRQSVREYIQALDLLVELPDVDEARLGSVGISLGAIRNVVLIAAEPRLRANVLCLAGADLPRVLAQSREPLVLDYLETRRERDGLSRDEVVAEFRREFRSDPALVAPAIENDRILLFLARFDDKVPYPTGLLLREKLGGPEGYLLPSGHYTAMVAAPWAARIAARWLRSRLASPPAPVRAQSCSHRPGSREIR